MNVLVERQMSVKHSGAASDLVLIPQPTNHPDDPLNWGRVRKEYHFWLLWIWGFIAAVSVNWVSSAHANSCIYIRTASMILSFTIRVAFFNLRPSFARNFVVAMRG